MPEITQQFGFDASGAIASIGQLNTALAALTVNLGNVARASSLLNKGGASKSLDTLAASAKKANAALAKTGKTGAAGIDKVNKSIKRATTSAKSFNISLETLSRIAIAQGIVRGLNAVQSKFSEAVNTAVELGSTLAEAAAISPRGIENFAGEVERLNAELIQSSNAFGLDVVDLAAAKYQEFSNQVKGAAESSALFDNANRLAVITGTSATQAVDALSSALNSYGVGVEGAARASAILFKTIELSRAKLSEIAGQLGNVTPLARAAGISFIEVGAALSIITQGGTGASRALTQIRGLINQLQKPTKELQRIFTEVFKVQNIQQAIQKFGGLAPVLQAIQAEADKTSSGFSKIFTNIRARTAITRLTQDSGLLTDAVNEITEAADNAEGVLGDLLAKFQAQDAQKFKVAIQELNNAFLLLAQDALPTLTAGLGLLTTGLEHIGAIGNALAAILFGKVALSFGAAALGAKTLAGNITGVSVAVLGMGVAIGLGVAALIKFFSALEVNDFKADVEGTAEATADAMATIADETKSAQDALRQFASEGSASFKSLISDSFAAQAAIKTANDAFVSSIGTSLDSIVKGREDILKKLESVISGFNARTEKRAKDSASINQKIEDTAFERRIKNFNSIKQASERQQRAENALSLAQRAPGVDTTEGLQKRVELLKEAERLAKASVSAAGASGERVQEQRASRTLLDTRRSLIGVNSALQKLDEKRTVEAGKALSVEKTRISNLKDATKEFRSLLSNFDEQGGVKSEKSLIADKKRIGELRKEITKLALAGNDLTGADIVGLAGLQDSIAKDLEGISPKFTGVKDALTRALISASKGLVLDININAIIGAAETAGVELPELNVADQVASISAARDGLIARQSDLIDGIGQYKEGLVKAASAAAKVESNVSKIVDHNDTFNAALSSFFGSAVSDKFGGLSVAQDAAQTFQDTVDKFIADPLAVDSLKKLGQALDELNRGGGDIPGVTQGDEVDVGTKFLEDAQAFIDAERQKQEAAELTGGATVQALEAEQAANANVLEALNKALTAKQAQKTVQDSITAATQTSASSATELASALESAAPAGEQIQSAVEPIAGTLSAGAGAANQLAKALAAAADEAERLADAQSSGGGATGKMFGGPMYRAFGGFVSRGSDTIPAMLSPGETVINARSSRRFASQIASMNAGTTPVYRANGGVVNNNSVNVGDINVNGTANPDDTARRVVSQLRREFRRGTSSRL